MIDSFRDEFSFLSNFYPCNVVMYGLTYPSVEHAYSAAKTLNPAKREEIRRAFSPGVAKKLGRKVELRPDWDEFRLIAMEELLRRKFAQPRLRTALLATGNEMLVEGNHWGDTFWGVCQAAPSKRFASRATTAYRLSILRGKVTTTA